MPIARHEPGKFSSQAVIWNRTVYLAGQVSSSGADSVEEQTREILQKIDELLLSVGSDRSRILSASVFLADITTWADMNAVWEEWVDPADLPARATIEGKLARPELLVEIVVIAAAGDD
jgi:enamine deaminase RidA (YjgF/YER057c/UK114 family)